MASITPPDSSQPQSAKALPRGETLPRAGAAAFSASLTLHLAAFFLFAIFVAAPAVDSEQEPVRAVGIVLTPPNSPVRFDDSAATTSPASPPAGHAETPAESLNRVSADALPVEAASAVRLPTLSQAGAAATPIVSAQELATGTRSGSRLSGARIAGEGDDENAIAEEQERLRPRLPTTAS